MLEDSYFDVSPRAVVCSPEGVSSCRSPTKRSRLTMELLFMSHLRMRHEKISKFQIKYKSCWGSICSLFQRWIDHDKNQYALYVRTHT